jgi:hypothetical protein
MPTYLTRYQNGECEQVWAELTALGERVRQESILSDALAVAYETMSRVSENVQRIVPRLKKSSMTLTIPTTFLLHTNRHQAIPEIRL